MKPRLLDLFCGAGGCSMGYVRAGFDVVGVDINPMPRYPFEFHQSDALEYLDKHGKEFDIIHASPPCQGYSITSYMPNVKVKNYPKLIEPVRNALIETGKPYIIENVVGAPLQDAVMLCGLMFDLRIYRHRLFETSSFVFAPTHISHPKGSVTNSYRNYSSFESGATHISISGHNFRRSDAVKALNGDCFWMRREELAEAIPPPYTEYIGRQMIQSI